MYIDQMNYFIQVLGCQMNHADAGRIAAFFESLGAERADTCEAANYFIVVMCSVRQMAVDRIYGLEKKIKLIKKVNPDFVSILTGCVTENDKTRFEMFFDHVLDVKRLARWTKILYPGRIENIPLHPQKTELCRAQWTSLIPISEGCDNFCSYCVVPYTRGPLKCRPLGNILKDVRESVKKGSKEIWLLGQNVNNYHWNNVGFAGLLRAVNNISGDFWIRFTSPHPKDFDDEAVLAMARCQKVTPYLNLPIQSGDDEILRAMKRPYSISQYMSLVQRLRTAFKKSRKGLESDLAVSTDVIVGFPGESRKRFGNTLKIFRKVGFDMVYVGKYSPRPHTTAAKLADSVSPHEKKLREEAINDIVRKTSLAHNRKLIGQTVDILVSSRKNDICLGKTRSYKSVKFSCADSAIKPGNIVPVRIAKALAFGLEGALLQGSDPDKKNARTRSPHRLIVVVGPTASGKSALAVKIAKIIGGEIISADSRQVYRGMDIGTNKITKKEMSGIPHYLLSVASPRQRFSVARYQRMALKKVRQIQNAGRVPILCGGTGLYISSVVDGIVIPKVKPDLKLRKKLEKLSTKELFLRLKRIDPRRARFIEQSNPRRLVRAIEIAQILGRVPEFKKNPLPYPILMIGIDPGSEVLKKRIAKRLALRLSKGLIKEVKNLHVHGLSWDKLESFGLEYRFVARFLQKKIARNKMIALVQKESEHYARRQMSWFGRDKRIDWIKKPAQGIGLAKKYIKD